MGLSRELANGARAWPFDEARKVLARVAARRASGTVVKEVLFETGYGPSGLPHIGTFGEVARTSWVRQAFEALSDVPTRLVAFSDDMDGFGRFLTTSPTRTCCGRIWASRSRDIPDPFGTHDSFGAHNNAQVEGVPRPLRLPLRVPELDRVLQERPFRSGAADRASQLREGARRRVAHARTGAARNLQSVLPVCSRTGRVLQVPIVEWNADAGTVVYDDDGRRVEVPVTKGHCKLQWKADWAMRWFAMSVDYEMSGKDLIPSVELSTKIVRLLGGTPPETFIFELFLDEQGRRSPSPRATDSRSTNG